MNKNKKTADTFLTINDLKRECVSILRSTERTEKETIKLWLNIQTICEMQGHHLINVRIGQSSSGDVLRVLNDLKKDIEVTRNFQGSISSDSFISGDGRALVHDMMIAYAEHFNMMMYFGFDAIVQISAEGKKIVDLTNGARFEKQRKEMPIEKLAYRVGNQNISAHGSVKGLFNGHVYLDAYTDAEGGAIENTIYRVPLSYGLLVNDNDADARSDLEKIGAMIDSLDLTQKQSDMLRALIKGYSPRVIAEKLGVNECTVKERREEIQRKALKRGYKYRGMTSKSLAWEVRYLDSQYCANFLNYMRWSATEQKRARDSKSNATYVYNSITRTAYGLAIEYWTSDEGQRVWDADAREVFERPRTLGYTDAIRALYVGRGVDISHVGEWFALRGVMPSVEEYTREYNAIYGGARPMHENRGIKTIHARRTKNNRKKIDLFAKTRAEKMNRTIIVKHDLVTADLDRMEREINEMRALRVLHDDPTVKTK